MIYTNAADQGVRVSLSWNVVGPDYLNAMGIGLAAGREFTAADREGAQRTVILNESLARQIFPGVNPLGRRIRFGRDDRTERVVVGVARNSKYSTLGERDRPAVYEPYLQIGSGRGMLNFMVKTTGPPAIGSSIR